MKVPDPIERGEQKCEDWHDQCVDGDEFVCDCGNRCKLSDGETLSPDPYAIPVCQDCFNDYMDEKYPGWDD